MELEKICYTQTFLKKVIFRIDYKNPNGLRLDDALIKTILLRFPFYETNVGQSIMVNITPESSSSESKKGIKHIFSSENKDTQIIIEEIGEEIQNIALTTVKYETWEDYISKVIFILESLKKIINKMTLLRIGLRFINQIPLQHLSETKKYFQKEVNTMFISNAKESSLSRLFIIKEFNTGIFKARFQFGVANQNYPSPILLPEFLLDVDVYADRDLENDTILEFLHDFHKFIQNIFETSITENLREKMGKKYSE